MINIKRRLLPVGGLTDGSGKDIILKTDYLNKWKELTPAVNSGHQPIHAAFLS